VLCGLPVPMFRLPGRMPYFKLLVVAQVALLAWRHLQRLDASVRHRLSELVRRLLGKLEPRAFAAATANASSPVALPRRLAGRSAS
jgi:hypothetical protein